MPPDEARIDKATAEELARLRQRVSELEQLLSEYDQVTRLSRVQHDLSAALSSAVGQDQALGLVVDAVGRIHDMDGSAIYLVDQQTGALELVRHKGLPPGFVQHASYYPAGSVQADLVQAGQPVYGRYRELGVPLGDARRRGSRGTLAVIPVHYHGQVIASLHAVALRLDELPASTRRTLEGIATQIGGLVERVKIDEALRQSQKYLQMLFDALDDFLFVLNSTGDILWVNLFVLKRLGYSEEELLDQPILKLHPPEQRDEAARVIAGILAGTADHCTIPLMAKDGATIPVETKITRGHWGSRDVFFGVCRDIAERLRTEETLRQNALELQARNEELDAFAETVAHDLKNPLNLIAGHTELLEREPVIQTNEKLLSTLRSIRRNGLKMSNIIDELLLLAEARKVEVEVQPLDMTPVVAEALQRLAYMIDARHPEIILPAAWPTALGYGPWVEEIWMNYISNAIKYGGQPPRVQLGAEVRPGGMIRFGVSDTARGLPSSEQARLFIPFTRLSQARARGHGLGLSIVRRIVEKLGGEVDVESDVDRGSVFSFTLRAAP